MTELMTIEQVAEYYGCSLSRAYSLMSENNIRRVSGYPAAEVTAIPRPGPGTRTDLARRRAGDEQVGPRPCCTRDSLGDVGYCSVCGWISPPEDAETEHQETS